MNHWQTLQPGDDYDQSCSRFHLEQSSVLRCTSLWNKLHVLSSSETLQINIHFKASRVCKFNKTQTVSVLFQIQLRHIWRNKHLHVASWRQWLKSESTCFISQLSDAHTSGANLTGLQWLCCRIAPVLPIHWSSILSVLRVLFMRAVSCQLQLPFYIRSPCAHNHRYLHATALSVNTYAHAYAQQRTLKKWHSGFFSSTYAVKVFILCIFNLTVQILVNKERKYIHANS